MKRRLFTILSALSLLLFVAVCVLWMFMHSGSPERARQQSAIENAFGALKLSIPNAREEGAYGKEVLVPAYRHAMGVLEKATGNGVTPELFIATVVTLPDGVRLELHWLDFGSRVGALRLKDENGQAHDFAITARWTDDYKKERSATAWQIEAVVILPQDSPEVDAAVGQFGPRPAIKLPKAWLDQPLTAAVVYDDGKQSNEVKVTRHTRR